MFIVPCAQLHCWFEYMVTDFEGGSHSWIDNLAASFESGSCSWFEYMAAGFKSGLYNYTINLNIWLLVSNKTRHCIVLIYNTLIFNMDLTVNDISSK